MTRLLGCAASAALMIGFASAQTSLCDIYPTSIDNRPVTEPEAEADLSVENLLGYRIENDECGGFGCDASTSDIDSIRAHLRSRAALADGTDGEAGANAPRADFDADAVQFRGGRRGMRRVRTAPQVIYLKFDGGLPTYPVDVVDSETDELSCRILLDEYEFTQTDRLVIRDRIATDFADFNIRVTLTEPTSGPYATIDYRDNDPDEDGDANITLFETDPSPVDGRRRYGFSILFGQAEGIDFGNDDYDNGAFSDVNFWPVLTQVFGAGTFNAFTGLPGTQEGLIEAVRNQAANTGAHEAGHALGLRHHDSFGAPDDGLPCADTFPGTTILLPECGGRPAPETFIPVYEGPRDADETLLHLMASGASVGLALKGSAVTNRFFSERSALKLEVAEDSRVFAEGDLKTDKRTHAKRLDLKRTMIPNTLKEGENSGGNKIAMDTAWVQGTLTGLDDVDEYVFSATRTKFVNAELISFSDSFIVNPVIATLRIFKINDDGSRTFISQNLQTFEPFDPLLVDIEVPEFGDYVLQVVPQEVVLIQGQPLSLNQPGLDDLLQGDYDLLIYQVDRALGASPKVR